METKVIGIFKPPADVEFKMKTEISQVAIYPVYDKNDKKIVDKMQLNLTLHLTVWLSGYLLEPMTKIIRQEISTEEMNEIINHLKQQQNGTNRL